MPNKIAVSPAAPGFPEIFRDAFRRKVACDPVVSPWPADEGFVVRDAPPLPKVQDGKVGLAAPDAAAPTQVWRARAVAPPAPTPEAFLLDLPEAQKLTLSVKDERRFVASLAASGPDYAAAFARLRAPNQRFVQGLQAYRLATADGDYVVSCSDHTKRGTYGKLRRALDPEGRRGVFKELRRDSPAPGKTAVSSPQAIYDEVTAQEAVGSPLGTGRLYRYVSRSGTQKLLAFAPAFATDADGLRRRLLRAHDSDEVIYAKLASVGRRLLYDVATALQGFLLARYIHLDIKPENILVGGDGAFVPGDLGLACALDARGEVARSTRGTPGFMPMEYARRANFTPASDIWSLGVTYFDLTGDEALFPGTSLAATKTDLGKFARWHRGLQRDAQGALNLDALLGADDPFSRAVSSPFYDDPEVATFVLERMLALGRGERAKPREILKFLDGIEAYEPWHATARVAVQEGLRGADAIAEEVIFRFLAFVSICDA